MKFWLILTGVVILGALTGPWLPWWSIAAVGFLLGVVFGEKPLAALSAGFLGGFLLWAGYAGWINHQNAGILSERMGQLFGGLPGIALVVVTGLFGGLLAGLGVLTGSVGRDMRYRS